VCVGALALSAAATALTSSPSTTILSLSVVSSDDTTHISLGTNGPVDEVDSFVLENPARLVIDLRGVESFRTEPLIDFGGERVARVRLGRHRDRVRVVVDVADDFAIEHFETRPQTNLVEILVHEVEQLASGDRPLAAEPAPSEPDPAQTEPKASGARRGAPNTRPPPVARADEQTGPRPETERTVRSFRGRKPRARLFEAPPGSNAQMLTDTIVRLGLADDRIRIKTRHAEPRYEASASFRPRAMGIRSVQPPDATSVRFDAELLEHRWLEASAFAIYKQADEAFEWASSKKHDDPFGAPGQRLSQGGGSFGSGPARLTVSHSLEESGFAGAATRDRRVQETTKWGLALALDDLWPQEIQNRFGPWWLSPSSAWVSFASGSLRSADSGALDPTRTRGLSLGLSWDRGRSSASASLWRSEHDAGRSAADWGGTGVDAGYGFYTERWGLFAGLSTQHSRSASAVESNRYGNVSLFLYPERLPALSATLDLNHWQGRYRFGESPWTRSNGVELGVDLSRYLGTGAFWTEPSLEASYRLERFSGSSVNESFGHTIAISLDLVF
jgi:hypothetical protein